MCQRTAKLFMVDLLSNGLYEKVMNKSILDAEFVKKSPEQWLSVNRWKKIGMNKLIVGLCPSISIYLELKMYIIQVIGSLNNVFLTLSIKSTPLLKEELLLEMSRCGSYHYRTISFNKGWTQVLHNVSGYYFITNT